MIAAPSVTCESQNWRKEKNEMRSCSIQTRLIIQAATKYSSMLQSDIFERARNTSLSCQTRHSAQKTEQHCDKEN